MTEQIKALADTFRAERYAAAQSAEQDYCWIYESDFLEWLLTKGILVSINAVVGIASVDTQGDHRYIPKHWPLCPSCNEGRGEEEMGQAKPDLNRREWLRKCAVCGHAWDHHDEPYMPNEPMLDDDGRYIHNGCVPYALSQVSDIPIAEVLPLCIDYGWRENDGMREDRAFLVAEKLGLRVRPGTLPQVTGKLTLRKLLDSLSPEKNYIVSTREHWLAVVRGVNMDQAETGMRSEIRAYWEVLKPPRKKISRVA